MTIEDKPLQPMRLDTRGLPLEEGLRLGHDLLGGGNTLLPLPGDPQKFSLSGELWVFAELAATTQIDMNLRWSRQRGTPPVDAIRYHVATEGRLDGIIDGEMGQLVPGDIMVMSNTVPLVADVEAYAGRFVSMSVASLGDERASGFGYKILRADDPETKFIASSIETFINSLKSVDLLTGQRLARMLRGVLETHLDGLLDDVDLTSVGGPKWQAPMLRFIEENLHNSGLSAEMLIESFPASRAVIYRTFEEFGGVSRYISRRRLERALSVMLFDQPDAPVNQIARELGFAGSSQFSTAFKKLYGVPPSEARAAFSVDEQSISAAPGISNQGVLMREMHERSGHV
ncbi:AraC family transcriptional regulator [Erythrobacter sp. F6033]|uniref:helix-turn-helix transcriptional regulator n=1 Tax=Erythrobacter sp. F6033 TaxID=2926401 RepID=UPI001FF0FD78|nr:AraC family transcriptional regulator [Erythrobacter sp. F6033]MCK0129239.1 AraC family transcriptional regulator [Erythrobacter sp. F6033]